MHISVDFICQDAENVNSFPFEEMMGGGEGKSKTETHVLLHRSLKKDVENAGLRSPRYLCPVYLFMASNGDIS